MMKGIVFNIQKFSINDGPGIRTTVFLKGCMLNCLWCHNPESKSPKPQLMFQEERCMGCGKCIAVCPLGLHSIDENGKHTIDRKNCIACGKCAENCAGALEITGREKTVDEVMTEVLKDKTFYETSGGGITLSGGEPLMQFDFTLSLLKKAKENGLHTCIETCGYSAPEKIEELIPYVDLFLWDVKESDEQKHIKYTGVSNGKILSNLRMLNEKGAKIILRCPIIPTYNDREEHLKAIGQLAQDLDGVIEVNVEPYHPLGQSKSLSLGEGYVMDNLTFPEEEMVKEWIVEIQKHTTKPVKKA